MSFKKNIFILHKILGLATGVVVFLVAITGCCWVFQEEINSFSENYKNVVPIEKSFLSPTQAKILAKEVFPDKLVHGAVFGKGDQALEVIFYEAEPLFYQSVFLNPYSGEVLQIEDHLTGFFAFVLKGHMWLWLPPSIGEQVVGASILLFVLLLISGFILWLPKKSKNLKQRLTFDWKSSTRWKRKNFDLHSVIGFYVGFLALIFSLTGLVMSYNWVQYAVYKTVGGEKNPTFVIPENTNNIALDFDETLPIDRLLPKLWEATPDAKSFEIHYPHSEKESIYVETSNSEGLYYDSDFRFYDQNTLEEIPSETIYGKYVDAKIADKIMRMNYDIHIGAIGGLAGKIIAFLSSLLIASLPVTGILLWYGRNQKKKKSLEQIQL